MMESQNKRTVVVGLFVFLGTLFLIACILLIGNLRETFTTKMEVYSLFDDVAGLQKGNNIWFSGVKIGTVNKLDFYGKSQVKVSLNIDVEAQKYIRKDAKVKLSSDGFIGNKILVIYGGTDKADVVIDGDELVVEKTLSTEDVLNTLQENNKNILAITKDFKIIFDKIVAGEGTIGKLLNDNSVFDNINSATLSLQDASVEAKSLMSSLAEFSANLNKKGTLASDLTSDTIVFKSFKASLFQLQQIADTASVFLDDLKQASTSKNTSLGVLLNDEEAGKNLKETITNLESSSKKLDEDLEAAQHSFLLRKYFKKKAKENAAEE